MSYDADADWAAVDGQILGTPITSGPDGALHFGSVDEFVRDYLRHVYKRRVDGRSRCWAAEWWRSEEAVVRLEALWRSWEAMRLDAATGMSEWFRDHADYHMAVLLDPDGPFAGATTDADTCRRGDPLPYSAPPEAMFPDVRVAS